MEFADLADQYENLKKKNAEIITVSTDTKFVHPARGRGREKMLEKVKFPMGADRTAKLSKLFGVYDEETGHALRGTFIISPEGKLLASEVNLQRRKKCRGNIKKDTGQHAPLQPHTDEACPALVEARRKDAETV